MSYWANEEVLKFIELYKKWPVMWDPTHSHYNDRNKVSEAWVRISDEMGIDVADLKRKRETLMVSFRLHKRKKKEAIEAAQGQDINYKPVWIFYEPLNEFLGDIDNNPNRLSTGSKMQHGRYKDESAYQASFNVQKTPPSKRPASSSAREPYKSDKQTKLPFKIHLPKSSKIEKSLNVEKPLNIEKSLNVEKSSNDSKEADDECELYGRLLVSKLKKLPENERQEVMLAIDSFIIDQSRNMRTRAQGQPSNPAPSVYSGVSSSSFSQSQNVSRAIISIPEYSAPEPFCVIQMPKMEQEKNISAENSCDPLNTSQEEAFSNSDDE